ncbi:TonB-dependent siderophore receptor [Nitrobacter sp.]|uniref:TonB-dependent siderophore receptor n=1 Tax=Nitrobacter sp. TaxID=29420 RepID=UPI0025EC1993|nr:TonB-dependent siderophore receptor [Nitrobacter sp.]
MVKLGAMMNPLTKKLYWMVCCGAVGYLPLSYQLAEDAYAQESTPLPTVTVTAPKAANRKPRTVARRATAPVRSTAVSRVAAPVRLPAVPYLTPSTGTIGQPPAPYAGGQVGTTTRVGMLGNRNVFDTPFNTTGYTSKLIRDQQANTISDVADNDPSVRTNSPRYSGIDGFLIRGFPVFSSDFAFDGLYGVSDSRRPAMEPIERVEILKGPSALLYGISPFGNVGGTVNLIPKRATDDPITRLTTGFVSNGNVGTAIDFGRRFGEYKEWGVRLNGAYRDGRTPIAFQTDGFGVGAAALDYRGERFRATVDLGFQKQNLKAPTRVRRVSPGFPIPDSPSLSINQQQPWEYYKSNHQYAALRAEYDLNDFWTLYGAYGHSKSDETFFGGILNVTNALGGFTSQPALTVQDADRETGEVGVRGRFATGAVKHSTVISATGLWQDNGNANTNVGPLITSNLYNPVYVAPRSATGLSHNAPLISRRINQSVAIADTMSVLDDRVLLTVGGRWQGIDVANFDRTTGAVTSRPQNEAITPAVALVVKPINNLSLYGNYIEGLTSAGTAPVGTVNAGQVLPAIVAKQIEVGAKYDFGAVGVSLAAFEITQPNGFTNPTTNIFSVDGEQRNRGLEFNTFGEVTPGLRLLGGVSLIDGVQTKTVGGQFDGRAAVGVPDIQFNLYGEYDLPFWRTSGVATLTGRVIYTSRQFYDQANTQQIPDWTRADIGARYVTKVDGRLLTLRAAVENVFGLDYWATTGRGFLTPGTPRTYRISASIDF